MKSKNHSRLILVFLLLGVLFLISSSFGGFGFAKDGADATGNKKQAEILVKFKTGVTSSQAQSVHSKLDGKVLEKVQKIGVHRVKIPEGTDISKKIKQYKQDPRVEYAEPNYKREAVVIPNDTYFSSHQWNMSKIKAPEAWDVEKGSNSVIIAVVDTGVSPTHPDLDGKLVAGYDYYGDPPFYNPDSDPSDENGHGTYVAGIAAAETNNGQGVAGVSWYSRIMPIRVLGPDGSGWDSDIADGIIWAADNGAKIINMSLGGPDCSTTVANAVSYAYSQGCVLIAASGNSNTNQPFYPAAYDHVIAVGATNSSDQRASFSNYGTYLDVTAPGEGITSTYFYADLGIDTYETGSGTSAASPHVAGLAALLASYYPTWTNDQIEQRIELMAEDFGSPGHDDYYGYGRINAYGVFLAMTNMYYIDSLYKKILFRSPDLPGFNSWVNSLSNGVSRTSVAYGFLSSSEHYHIFASNLYQQILNRSSDSAGLFAWVAGMQAGLSERTVQASFYGSDEYFAQLSPRTNQQYVGSLYQKILGRTPQGGEEQAWVNALNSGASRSGVAYGFLSSSERYNIFVRGLYTDILSRMYDSSGLAAWITNMQAGLTERQVTASFYGSSEYSSILR